MGIAVAVGVLVGATAGCWRPRRSCCCCRLTELVLVFPTFFLLILAGLALGRGVELLILVIEPDLLATGARIIARRGARNQGARFHPGGPVGRRGPPARTPAPHPANVSGGDHHLGNRARSARTSWSRRGLSHLGLGVQPPLLAGRQYRSPRARRCSARAWWVTGARGRRRLSDGLWRSTCSARGCATASTCAKAAPR